MHELRGRTGLANESLLRVRRDELASQDLDRHEPLEQAFAREVNRASPALTQQAEDLVLRTERVFEKSPTNVTSGGEGRVGGGRLRRERPHQTTIVRRRPSNVKKRLAVEGQATAAARGGLSVATTTRRG